MSLRDEEEYRYENLFGTLRGIHPHFQLPAKLRIALPDGSAKMLAVPDTIEAEVLEIDGSPAPPPSRDPQVPPQRGAADAWRAALQGRVFRLDKRWWPLWVLLGIVALTVLAVVGVFLAVFFVAAKILGGILRLLGLARGGSGHSRGSTLIRRGP